MAEETTSTASDQQLSQIINQLLVGKTAQPAVDPNTGPSSREGRGILSLLGEGLGGGSQYGTTAEREQGGLSALGALGSRMLQASDWSVMPHSFGSILGQGLDAARGNLGHTQAVSAARQYAAQQLAHEQQQDQIARLKEALPYLQLQEDQRAAARQRELLKPGSTNTSIGNAGATSGTFFDALAQIESGDANIVSRVDKDSKGRTLAQGGNPDEISQGHYQINPDTWRRYAKQAGVDPSQFPNPMKAPKEVQAQVASVIPLSAFGPRTQKLLRDQFGDLDTSRTIGALAGARAAPPKAAPGAPGQAATPPTGRATLPPPEPALGGPARAAEGPAEEAGTVQVAGTDVGAPTGTVIPPSPPGSDATVAEIEAGRASSPARTGAQPGAVVTAQAGGQQPSATQLPPIKAGDGLITHPGTYSEYRAREFVPPPQTEDFNPNLTPAQQAAFASEAKAIEQRALAVSAMRKPDEKSVQEILAAREEIKAKIQMAAQEKAQKAALAITKYNETQDNAIRPRYEKEVDAYKAAAQSNLVQQQKLGEIDRTAAAARETEAAKQEGQYILEDRKKMAESRDAARQSIDQVHILRALSDRAGIATALENITLPNGQTVRDVMVQHGLGDEKTLAHLNGQQAYEMAATQMVMDLRKGVQMGNLSDGDLRFLQKVVPKGSVTPEGRADMLATIELIHDRKREYIDRVHQLWDQGKGLSWEKAKVEADKQMGDIVPRVPQEYKTMSDQERDVWWKANTKPRMLLRTPDELNKDGKVTRRGHLIQVPEAPQ